MSSLYMQGVTLKDLSAHIAAEVAAEVRAALAETSKPLLVDGQEMARQLGVSINTIDRLRADGTIPSVRLGSRRMYDPGDVMSTLKAASKMGGAANV